MVYTGSTPPTKPDPFFVACPLSSSPKVDEIKAFLTPLCSSKSHRYGNYDKTLYIVSSYSQFHNGDLCQVIHFLPLTYNQENLRELYNQDLEEEVISEDIKKEDMSHRVPWDILKRTAPLTQF